MKIKLINGAQMPKQGRPGDAGYDLFLNDDVVFKAHTTTVVDTGVWFRQRSSCSNCICR